MKQLKYRFRLWKQIAPQFEGVKLWYGGDILSEIAIRILGMLFPVVYGIFLEKVILGRDMSRLLPVAGGYVFLQFAKSGAVVFQKACQNKVNNAVYRKIRVRALDRYLHMRFEAYQNLTAGDIKLTLEDAVNKLTSFQTQMYQYCLNGVYGLVIAVILAGISWRLALVAFLAVPVTFFLDRFVRCREKGVNQIINENDASWTTWLDETIKCWREVRVNRCENKRRQEFEEFQVVDETYFVTWLRFWVTRVLVIPKIKDSFMMQFLLYFLGGILIYYNYISIGMLLVFVQYYGMLSDSVKAVSSMDAGLQSEKPHYERILKHLAGEEMIEKDGTLLPERYDISFEHVSFRYAGEEREAVHNLSFYAGMGSRVGFYGESGAGKSTVIKLLLGQLTPLAGSISYGTVPLKDICKRELYQRIAYISQEARLFRESIAENLRMGKADASLEEMAEACKRAGIYDFIRSLPEGFETEIGENGALLSGGQRQRLLLAKAFLRDADIYIFDEATSALDAQTEEHIKDTLKSVPGMKTVLVIAHKEQFLELCDSVVRLS